MTFDAVFNSINGGMPVDLLPQTHKSLYRIYDKPFYIETQFIRHSSNLNPRFILISAPGATGKTAFGQYIAYEKKALYWNLAEINIGDGTFQGSLYRALGASRISDYAQGLQTGKYTIIIDALDEAEMVSGRKNVETFIKEANEYLENSKTPSVILLSRTEAAQNIISFFKMNSIPFIHYEIGYFTELQAREFITKTIEKKKIVTETIRRCIDEYFDKVKRIIDDKEVNSRFIGYAPVLEAIAAHIMEIPNSAKLLSELKSGLDEATWIKSIMESLLCREQEKVKNALKERIKDKDIDSFNWDGIYTNEEQLVRDLNYILFGEVEYEEYSISSVPIKYLDDYIERLNIFVPQHPFILSSFKDDNKTIDYAGPAFRDYSLSFLFLSKKYEVIAELYYQRENASAHFPSQLFWEHYIDFNNNRIRSLHFPYVIEAYKSKNRVGVNTYLDIFQDEEESICTFRSEDNKGNSIENITLEVDIVNNQFVFENLVNTAISVLANIKLRGNEVYITNSSIFCNQIIIDSNKLVLNSYSPHATTVCCKEELKSVRNNLTTSVESDDDIQIDAPNIFLFPKLVQYKKSLLDSDDLDIYIFIHSLRRIFLSFRTHKKDMPAKDAEKIDYVVIADNKLKAEIFSFLKEKGIIFRFSHLYKIDLEKMSEYEISWGALTSTNVKQLHKVYSEFCIWKKQKDL